LSNRFADIAFTPAVLAEQAKMGSRRFYERQNHGAGNGPPLGADELEFVAARDSFYMASVSETNWPYVQHRGGPVGFLKTLSASTLGFADFRGNRQYVSVGNFVNNDRVAIILMDYPGQQRLKILGHARTLGAEHRDVLESLRTPGSRALIEHGIIIEVSAYDWNCPQHITPRFTESEVETAVAPLRSRLAQLEAELRSCKAKQ
jgi:uncharacterized protein